MNFINQDLLNDDQEEPVEEKSNQAMDSSYSSAPIEVNNKNEKEFSNLMEHARKNYDNYWDKNNVFLRIFMLLLGLFIIGGTIYFIVLWNTSK